jgi:hypothetical protein
MFFSFQLVKWGGIQGFLMQQLKIHSRLRMNMEKETEEKGSLSQNTSDTIYIHAKMNLITSLWLESSFRNMLWMDGLLLSSGVLTGSREIRHSLEQIHIMASQMHWQLILRWMPRNLASVSFFPLPSLAALKT